MFMNILFEHQQMYIKRPNTSSADPWFSGSVLLPRCANMGSCLRSRPHYPNGLKPIRNKSTHHNCGEFTIFLLRSCINPAGWSNALGVSIRPFTSHYGWGLGVEFALNTGVERTKVRFRVNVKQDMGGSKPLTFRIVLTSCPLLLYPLSCLTWSSRGPINALLQGHHIWCSRVWLETNTECNKHIPMMRLIPVENLDQYLDKTQSSDLWFPDSSLSLFPF